MCIYTYIYIYVHTMCMYIYIHIHICMYMCMYVYIYIYTYNVHILCMYVYLYPRRLGLWSHFPMILQIHWDPLLLFIFVQWPVSIRHHHRIIRRQMLHQRSQIFLKRRTTGRAKTRKTKTWNLKRQIDDNLKATNNCSHLVALQ